MMLWKGTVCHYSPEKASNSFEAQGEAIGNQRLLVAPGVVNRGASPS